MSDTEGFAGTAAEFLQMRDAPQATDAPTANDDFIEPDSPAPTAAQSAEPSATATDETEPESRDDGLTAEERVAAVYGLETAEGEGEGEAADGLEAAAPEDSLEGKTAEELRQLAEEYLKLKAEMAESNVDGEQKAFQAEVDQIDQHTRAAMRQHFEQTVEARSDDHYGQLIDQAEAALLYEGRETHNLRGEELEAFYFQNVNAVRRPILRAQRQWEIKKATEFEPLIDEAIVAERKRNPKVRARFAEFLCDFRPDGTKREAPLPRKAAEELIKITNTDDMPVFAQSLEDAIKLRNKERRSQSQTRRSDAARQASQTAIATPPRGAPRSQKPVELKGTADEWLAMNRMDGSTFSRRS
jgi:hypothetical protein